MKYDLTVTERTADALQRFIQDLFADPSRYTEIDDDPDFIADVIHINNQLIAPKDRSLVVWETIRERAVTGKIIRFDAERRSRWTKDLTTYAEKLDKDGASASELAVPAHLLQELVQLGHDIPAASRVYLAYADKVFPPDEPHAWLTLPRAHTNRIEELVYELLDDRRLHDLIHLSHRQTQAIYRAVKRAVKDERESTSYIVWHIPVAVIRDLTLLVHGAITSVDISPRFATYADPVLLLLAIDLQFLNRKKDRPKL